MVNIAVELSKHLVAQGVVPKNQESILKYGLELIWTTIVGVSLLAVISVVIGRPWAWVYFLIGYVPLRRTAGGYHAPNKLYCYTISTLTFGICVLFTLHLRISSICPILWTLVSGAVLWILSPIEAENKPLRRDIREKNRKMSLQIICGDLILALIIWFVEVSNFYFVILFLGVLASSVFLVVGKIDTLIVQKKEKQGDNDEHN